MASNLVLPEKFECVDDYRQIDQVFAKVISVSSALNPEELFMSLYNKYHEKIRRYTSILYKNQEDYAEDIVQEIFMKLWEKRDKLYMIEFPENYLSIMIKNQFLMDKRSVKRKTKLLTQFESQKLSQDDVTEQDVFNRESKMMIDKGIKKLPPRMKTAITLRQEGYKIKEIALLMNINNCTAKNHVIKALGKMKIFLN